MKSFVKWAAIAVAGLIAYVFIDGLTEERKNALFIIFVICSSAYSVMDYVNTKQRETMEKLEVLHYKLDQVHGAIPGEYHIAKAVSDYLDARAKEAKREADLLSEVNSIVSQKI